MYEDIFKKYSLEAGVPPRCTDIPDEYKDNPELAIWIDYFRYFPYIGDETDGFMLFKSPSYNYHNAIDTYAYFHAGYTK